MGAAFRNIFRLLLVSAFTVVAFSSCEFRQVMTYDEIYLDHMAVFDYDIDWSNLSEKPSGMTIIFYPIESSDTKTYQFHTNAVSHFHAVLPDQDYALICFNQSEEEFALLKFSGLDQYVTSIVTLKSDEELGTQGLLNSGIIRGTRGYNASGVLTPGDIASSSISSVRRYQSILSGSGSYNPGGLQGNGGLLNNQGGLTPTRGYNASGVLTPGDIVNNMSITIHVVGLEYTNSVSGTLTGLSCGRNLANKFPLAETLDQNVTEWVVTRPSSDVLVGTISANVGTFGIPVEGSRALTDDFEPNVLHLSFTMTDNSVVNFDVDITEDIRDAFEENFVGGSDDDQIANNESGGEGGTDNPSNPQDPVNPEEPNKPATSFDIYIEVGADTTPSDDPLTDDPDATTSEGTIILHRTEGKGFHVGVEGWGEEVIHDIVF